MKGLIHIYIGDGKGKTTAAMGLAVRAAGSGKNVSIVQFFKTRDTGEMHTLAQIKNIQLNRLKHGGGFTISMNEQQKQETKNGHTELLQQAMEQARKETCDLLILDEVLDAYDLDLIDKSLLEEFVSNKPDKLELVMTGRAAKPFFIDHADYVSNIQKIKHPYDQGIKARKGIEY